ncbi:transglycosylase domain-containing protein [Streptomyces sp. VNUA116]|uniref:transglycosylase domain-containing protein n=1 Tax=Streptomyces sp. VNUA116 TaxID=3062449 RepID=UPI0026750EF0|nr:transglycosylase domain-containing protein [Streptomyces sp. VNUA116]WKU45030.1 transglycosylase domain-containing protein [Streptomyces sp. VNUA116]
MSDEHAQRAAGGGRGAPAGWAPRAGEGPGRGGHGGRPGEPGRPRRPGDGGNGDGGPGGNGNGRRPRRTGWRRLLPTWRMVVGGILLVVLLIAAGLIAGYMLVQIPAANQAAVAESNVFLYADGSQLARDGEVNRESVPLSKVPRDVQHAVLAAEDRDFYSESAVNPEAMLRAAWNTVTGKGKQSGSTITQQYVKNYYLGQEQTISRKVKEFFIAIKLDREESKDDILEGYLNTSYFGRNAYGIQAASQAYYGKDSDKLNTAEGAYLATLLNAPSLYDVGAHPENQARATARWNYVLDGMVKKKWLSQADRSAMKFPAPGKARARLGMSGQRGYLVEAVKDYLTSNKIVDEQTLARGGYRITTTVEKKKQDAFVSAVQKQLMDELSDDRAVDRYVRAGGASVDPRTGRVVALYGGIDYTKQFVNNATRRDFQVGSTFKPFVFTSAVANDASTQDGRTITPFTLYDGTNKRPVQGPNGPVGYAPANEDDRSYGQITVTKATDLSVNAVYAQMAQDVGPAKVKDTAVALGIPSNTPDLNANPSIALGVANASVLDMAQAYATLANHGRHGTYTLVDKVTKGAEVVPLPGQDVKQAVTRTAADTTTSILESVVDNGTGRGAQAAGRPAAGKTGTAEDDKAAWFAGYTPDLATVVAVMGQDSETGEHKSLYGAAGQARINGGGFPADIWAAYTAAALSGTSVKDFDLELESGARMPTMEPTIPAPPTTSAPPSIPAPPTPPTPSFPPLPPTGPPTGFPTRPPTGPPSIPGLPTFIPNEPKGGGGLDGGLLGDY